MITIGDFLGTDMPIVSISRVTITGGLNSTQPTEHVAFDGGVWIPEAAATVTIADSVITNRLFRVAQPSLKWPRTSHVQSSTTLPSGSVT